MAISRRMLETQLAIAHERIRGLEAMLLKTQEVLLAAVGQPAVIYQGDPGAAGPGFALLGQQALANAEPEKPEPPREIKTEVHWFRADGADPAIPLAGYTSPQAT